MTVAVVGVGIHLFGRHDGVSGLRWRRSRRGRAARRGVGWQDVEFAAGGSDAAGNADTTVSVLGLTGVPFINVRNGCATGGSALATAHAMSSGAARSRWSSASTSTRPARSTRGRRTGAWAPGTARPA